MAAGVIRLIEASLSLMRTNRLRLFAFRTLGQMRNMQFPKEGNCPSLHAVGEFYRQNDKKRNESLHITPYDHLTFYQNSFS